VVTKITDVLNKGVNGLSTLLGTIPKNSSCRFDETRVRRDSLDRDFSDAAIIKRCVVGWQELNLHIPSVGVKIKVEAIWKWESLCPQ
jgi:hypothetical protein